MPSRLSRCPKGCHRFDKLPVGAYYRRCGRVTLSRIARGEPVSAYKKVNPQGSVEMLLKSHGWGPGKRAGGKAAPYYQTTDNPCVFQLSREWAARHADQRALFAIARAEMMAEMRRRRVG